MDADFDISAGNLRMLEFVKWRRDAVLKEPHLLWPWWRPCRVSVLLVTDGGLDFGPGDFGLSTFVDALVNDRRSYVRFSLTLAHRRNVSDAQVMRGAPGIAASIKNFAFDNVAHFTPNQFDEVWLFGIETAVSPLRPAEVTAITRHMNRGGGVFATGDHDTLGAAMGAQIPRVRNMRYWADFTSPAGSGEVGMTTQRRNDSNQIGHDAGSQFSDQSDDIPQPLDLKLYATPGPLVAREARYPHPVMCGRNGRITIFPDHPHEGEARVPDDLTLTVDGADEYPMARYGAGRVRPEVVAHGRVRAGNAAIVNDAPTKDATAGHTFGVVSTYDGHRAVGTVGRVVCDSTWHHFVNVNLVGLVEGGIFDDFPGGHGPGSGTFGTHASKHIGFLYSAAGQAALDTIREYYVNVAVWIAPAERHSCFRRQFIFDVIWAGRVVEAALTKVDTDLNAISLKDLAHIGIHARDVIGRRAGQCQSLHWVFDVLDLEELQWVRPWIDPWMRPDADPDDGARLPWVDPEPIVNAMVGAAVLAVHRKFPMPLDDPDQLDKIGDDVRSLLREGAAVGARRVLDQTRRDLRTLTKELPG